MALTRRNVLVLLFTVVAAAGVIGGTGAFSTVNADRTIDVSTTGDASANVAFELSDSAVNDYDSLSEFDGDDAVLGLDFDNINLDANTTYNNAMNITVNNQNSNSYTIDVVNTPDGVDLEFADDGGTEVSGVNPGDTQQLDIIITTEGDTNTNDADVDEGEIEFEVTQD